jgi:hypothetical protein
MPNGDCGLELAEFLRIFPMRGSHLMWLLGAGASASAGIPTAGDMIWDFKRRLYCSENRLPLKSVPDIGDASFRLRLNQYFASQSGFPAPDGDDEYPFYFERTYAHERDRRSYISSL